MKLLIICGATATGKTKLAVECAKKLNSEIISADSQLVYKGLDIGTAKPTKIEMDNVKHHLIDVIQPQDKFNVYDYNALAEPIVEKLISLGKVPIVCGGTGFYINSLIYNLSYGSCAENFSIREKYNIILKENGKEYLFELLMQVDKVTAKKLHVNDVKRVIRALEIYENGGIKKSEICDNAIPKREYLAVAIDYPREELYNRIDTRVDNMINCGLVEEVNNLLKSGVSENNQSMQAIGYKEVVDFLKNKYNHSTMRDMIKKNTRHYAKRQITFFKKIPNIVWLKPEYANEDKVLELLNE